MLHHTSPAHHCQPVGEREGLLVVVGDQQGAIDEVWREPVDEETALFLGYARVVRDDAAHRVLAAAALPPAYAVAL
ncbi:MAG TPA: hypothetical protein VM430_10480, partial [Microbacterium sp.]|nr:hypothetical protein [Microbacterium sp.]